MNYNVLLNCQTHSKFLALNMKCFQYQKIPEKFDKLKRDTLQSNSIICKFICQFYLRNNWNDFQRNTYITIEKKKFLFLIEEIHFLFFY